MIYTVTFNPAVDYVVYTSEMAIGEINRASDENVFFGGKGINVSLILNELGVRSKALGFVAGFTGVAIESSLREKGIETDFVHLKNGISRINVKIKSGINAYLETELNGKGPEIDEPSLDELYKKLDAVSDGDTLVLAGSIPKSMPADTYQKILERMEGKNIRTIVDARKDLLMNVLKYKPYMVKPNHHELGEIFGVTLRSVDEITEYALKLKEMGPRNVLVSMAGDGALLLDENGETHICKACRGIVHNSVGAGDSLMAGFLAGLDEKGDIDYAMKLGTAAGGATAFSHGLAVKEEIFELLKSL